jgi:hypothetical protein
MAVSKQSIESIIGVDIIVSPTAAQRRSFGRLLVLGNSAVIDTTERMREFTSITDIAAEFGTSAPEYLAASKFFAQLPQPNTIFIGRWARTATKALLKGAVRSAAQQALSNFTVISSGGFAITIDGTVRTLSALDFSACANLNAVAAIVDTGLSTWANCVWNAVLDRFEITSTTTGATSTLAAVSTTATSTALGLPTGTIVNGIAAESPVTAATILADLSNNWYGLTFADTNVTNQQHIAVSDFIEAASPSRIYGATTQEAAAYDSASTTDLPYLLDAGAYSRTMCQFSSTEPYAVASIFGRMFTVDFTGDNTTITLKFKQEPGIVAEELTTSRAGTLDTKHCNVFIAYDNDTSILQQGWMANGRFIDEVHGLDWLANAVQTDMYNLLYQSTTKVPQTEAGVGLLVTSVERTCGQAVTNGLLAPGTWTAQGFGKLNMGDYLPKGFYVYATPLSAQSQADREARKAPLIQVAAKMAGAVHSANVQININR